MFNQTTLTTLPIKVGYYKFIKLNGNKAVVEFKEEITSDLKVMCIVDMNPLFDLRSSRPHVKSLYRKVIRVINVGLNHTKEVEYCDWCILDSTLLHSLTQKELISKSATVIDFKSLSTQEQLAFYMKAKADPTNVLPEDNQEGTYEDDYAEFSDKNLSDTPEDNHDVIA